MSDSNPRIAGLAEVIAMLDGIARDLVSAAAKPAAEAVIDVAKPYPAASRAAQPFRSSQARRYFFAALRSGQIEVPYRRTGALGNAWAWAPTASGANVINAHPHADMVVSSATRFAYHVPTWRDEQQIAKDATEPATQAAEEGIIAMVVKNVDRTD